MKLRYLCANHRQWLTADTDRAERAWLDWVERGTHLCEERSYAEAIPYLGCAFDLASFLLGECWPGYAVAAVRFSDSARQLMDAYRQCGDAGLGNYILVGASSRLARELHNPRNDQISQITADCLRTLYGGEPHTAAPQLWPRDSAGARRLH
ncbi:hypothetical protein [Microbulbifer marinus]|uniref:Uncharacterized protein n=1 Tax=Microbulbifer marinus TaxID=658218 RepID=A0A1H3Z6H2_9GAMM|nr:hypothetical protein [Microbulbifer marinus]SEA19413.1 hypothetical protein SAMN05216562_2229 [Microbulbifer marinus]